eukprot:m.285298 g.285298  ORF g.285298 m.285298 type:complete len:315 (-) comp17773_c0_seq1:10259-11203(-)
MANESFQLNISTASSTGKSRPVSRQRERLNRGPTTVYVGQLHPEVDDEILFELGLQAGPVSNATVVRLRETAESRGYGFIDFEDMETVEYACQLFNGLYVFDRAIRVRPSDHSGSSTATPDTHRPQMRTEPPRTYDRQPSSSNLRRQPSFNDYGSHSHSSRDRQQWPASEPARYTLDYRAPYPRADYEASNHSFQSAQSDHFSTQSRPDAFQPSFHQQQPSYNPPQPQNNPHWQQQYGALHQSYPRQGESHQIQQPHRPWRALAATQYGQGVHIGSAQELVGRLRPEQQQYQAPDSGSSRHVTTQGSIWTAGRT